MSDYATYLTNASLSSNTNTQELNGRPVVLKKNPNKKIPSHLK